MKLFCLSKTSARVQLPYIALVLAVLATAVSAMFVRWADAPGTVTMFYRTILTGLVLLPFRVQTGSTSEEPNQPVKTWLVWAVAGGMFFALDAIAWATAVQSTRVANATFFNTIAPVWVALFSFVFLHDRPSKKFWTGLVFTLFGVILMLGLEFIRSPQLGKGDFLAIVSSFFYAGSFLVTQIARRKAATLAYTRWVAWVSGVVLLIFNLATGRELIGYSALTWLSFFGAALISQVIGYLSLSYALGHIPATVVSTTMLAKPVIAALLAVPLFSEALTLLDLAGGLLVLAGIYLVNRSR